MSSVTAIGSTEFRTTGCSVTLSELGVVGAINKYMLSASEFTVEEAQEWGSDLMGDEHHEYGHLVATASSVSCSGPFHNVSVTYKGVPDDTEFTKIKITASVSQEPIETHPQF